MAATHRQTPAQTTSALPPLRALVVIDGSARMGRVVDYAMTLAQSRRPVELVLLGIVSEPYNRRLRGCGTLKHNEVHARLMDDVGRRAVGAAARRVDQAGLAHRDRIEVGDPVETIVNVASEEGCDLIVVADAPAAAIARWLPAIGLALATVATQLIQAISVPVVVVK